ncbi:MAG: DUF4184 family protein [Flavobacterium sp.]
MPFTFSHPAIVLPLTFLPKGWFSITGLVIGSLTPDFEYFIRMRIQSDYSHTLGGLFWFDLPLGIVLAFIFHNVVRDILFDNLPVVLKSRLVQFTDFHWNVYFRQKWLVVIISVLIGAASHIFWDSFTHDHGYFVETIPALQGSIEILDRQIPILKILQHTSTFLGAIVILFAIAKLPSDKSIRGTISLKYWVIVLALTVLITAVRLSFGLSYKLFGHLLVTAISALMIALIISSLITIKVPKPNSAPH